MVVQINILRSLDRSCCVMCSSSDTSFRLFSSRYCSRHTPRKVTDNRKLQVLSGKVLITQFYPEKSHAAIYCIAFSTNQYFRLQKNMAHGGGGGGDLQGWFTRTTHALTLSNIHRSFNICLVGRPVSFE